jgi:hypothetical protein
MQLNKSCPIDEMSQLIDHISSFENMINNTKNLSDPVIVEECELFKRYIKNRTRDFNIESLKEFKQIPSL